MLWLNTNIKCQHYAIYNFLFWIFLLFLMKAHEICRLPESDDIKNRREGVDEVLSTLKVTHQKWISKTIFRWDCDETLFLSNVCVGEVSSSHFIDTRRFCSAWSFLLLVVVRHLAQKSVCSELQVCCHLLNLNMQIIIIFKQGQSLKGTLRTTLLKTQILFAFRVSVISWKREKRSNRSNVIIQYCICGSVACGKLSKTEVQ